MEEPICPDCHGTRLIHDQYGTRSCIRCDKLTQWKKHLGELTNDNYARIKTTPLLQEYPTHKSLIIEYDAPEILKAHIKCFLKSQKDANHLPLLKNQWKEYQPYAIMKESIEGEDAIMSQYSLLIINLGGGGPGFPKYPKAAERHISIIAARLSIGSLTTWIAIQGGLASIMRESDINSDFKGLLKSIERSRSIRLSAENTVRLAAKTPNEKLRNTGFGPRGVDTTLLDLNPALTECIEAL